MDILNHYEVINYAKGDIDKYAKCTVYYMNGKKFRDNDLPAYIDVIGNQKW